MRHICINVDSDLVPYRMIELQIAGLSEVEFELQGVEVHCGAGDGLQAEGGAGEVDVLGDVACIHCSEFVVGGAVIVLVGDLCQCVGLGIVEADTSLGADVNLHILHVDG